MSFPHPLLLFSSFSFTFALLPTKELNTAGLAPVVSTSFPPPTRALGQDGKHTAADRAQAYNM
eukprot:scaffold286540_cov36-Tisochrysis_lutea.AAC.5